MTENPYQPPTEVATSGELEQIGLDSGRVPVGYVGGMGLVAIIGLVCGAVFGGLAISGWRAVFENMNPFVIVAVLWFAALGAVMSLLRGVNISIGRRIGIGVLLMPVGYALYVPICSFGAIAMTNGYQNTEGQFGTLLSSVITFTLVLLMLAAVVRLIASRRVKRRISRIKSL